MEKPTSCINNDSLNLAGILNSLSHKRPLFHSEADFQFALAWEIQLHHPNASVRLEYCPKEAPHLHLDLIVELNGKSYPIELKYKTRKLECVLDDECYNLKNHGAQDTGKYDCLLDIQRLEQCRHLLKSFGSGYVIWLTNDPSYWSAPQRAGTTFEAFSIHEKTRKFGTMAWASHTGPGTKAGRENPITLTGTYSIHWADYSHLPVPHAGDLRYVLLEINRL